MTLAAADGSRRRRVPPVGSCRSCQHYGWLASRSQCSACEAWNRDHPAGDCAGCDRPSTGLVKQHCRGCWKQAAHQAGPHNTEVLLSDTTRFPYQQLALTGLPRHRPGGRQPRLVWPKRLRPADPHEGHVLGQLELFATHRGLRAAPAPRPQQLAWDPQGPRAVAARYARLTLHLFSTLEAVAEYGRAHRWSPTLQDRSRVTLITALNHRAAGSRLSRAELIASGGPAGPLATVLAQLGLLDDPPTDPLQALIERRAAGLSDGMRCDLTAWMVALRDGGPRTKPKTYKTVQEYSRWVLPLLILWGRKHEHLREITPSQVHQGLLAVPAGSARHNTFVAVRALFGFLHRDRRIFTNPTARTHLGTRHPPAVLPLTEADYQRVAARAITELHRVVLVLAAVHGARPHQIRALRRDDVNITGRYLTVAGVRRDLDDLSVGGLGDWLRYRQRRWPLSNNPHLLVGEFTAQDDRPLSAGTLCLLFRGTGITLDQLRADRHLEEALAYGPDPLHLAHTFGISTATGMRYANEAKHLLGADGLHSSESRSP